MKAVILGGTRGIGRELARQAIERGDDVFLLGRSSSALARRAEEWSTIGSGRLVGTAICDLEQPETISSSLDTAHEALGGFDTVIVTAAGFEPQEVLESDRELCTRVLSVNFERTVAFCEQARTRLLAAGGGTLCVFSSVAADRARTTVVLYGASKAGLEFYLRGLDVRFRRAGLRTVCVKPGFVHTEMTAGLPAPPFAAQPERVASIALRAIDRGTRQVYAPPVWRWIMFAVRAIPTPLLRRMRF